MFFKAKDKTEWSKVYGNFILRRIFPEFILELLEFFLNI